MMKTKALNALVFLALTLALITAAGATERWIKVIGGKWEPSQAILSHLEAQIESYVKSQAKAQGIELKKWQDYTFQYQGQEEKGRRYVFINALCGSVDRQIVDKQIIFVLGGGSCFFNLKYDPLRKIFFDLLINGEA